MARHETVGNPPLGLVPKNYDEEDGSEKKKPASPTSDNEGYALDGPGRGYLPSSGVLIFSQKPGWRFLTRCEKTDV
jgi:hypothetical protein